MTGEPAEVEPDPETRAMEELGARRGRLEKWVLLIFVATGALLGIPGYFLVRAIQFELWGVNWALLSGAVGFAVPVFSMGWLGKLLAQALVWSRTRAILDEVCARHGASPARVRELVSMLDHIE